MAYQNNELKIEHKLWETANKLRGSMDSSQYRNVVLGLIFLKYVSDSFEEKYNKLKNSNNPEDAEDRDFYIADNIFWLPKKSRWEEIRSNAKNAEVGQIVDNAMILIEKENNSLKGILPKNYSSPDLDRNKLGEVIDVISNINVGDSESQKSDLLGRVYEYFLNKFAAQEGTKGGEFFTPRSVVNTLVKIIEPFKGRVYDPCCGSGGMFVQSEKFVQEHQGKIADLAVYGEESNPTTWKLAKMNLAIRGIDNNLGPHYGNTFTNDLHKGIRFDYILANPPFNLHNWDSEKLQNDSRWKYGIPPSNNANYAWVQHIISKLKPDGKAGFILSNGALSSDPRKQDANIRKNLIQDDKIDAIISLPAQLFYSTEIPVSLWIINMDKDNNKERKRSGETLFIDARNLGKMLNRKDCILTNENINDISKAYHSYCGTNEEIYYNQKGFCKIVSINDIKNKNYSLVPGNYIDIKKNKIDNNMLKNQIYNLVDELSDQLKTSSDLNQNIDKILNSLKQNLR